MNLNKYWPIFCACLVFFITFAARPGAGAAKTVKVAILPVKIHAAENMDYLQAGLMDMLASRISWEDKVVVLEKTRVEQVASQLKGEVNRNSAISLAEKLGADFIVSSSVTLFGAGGSIDIKVFSGTAAKPPMSFYEIVKDATELIPKFSQVAENVSTKVFGKKVALAAAGPAPRAPAPERMSLAPFVGRGTSPVAPRPRASIRQQLIRQKPIATGIRQEVLPGAGVAGTGNFWQSQLLDYAIESMDVGDVFGDGGQELVAVSHRKVLVYGYSVGGLRRVAEFPGTKNDLFAWVGVADINQNGLDEIYVTNIRKLSASKRKVASFVLEWNGNGFSVLSRDLDYYLRIAKVPGRPARLLGQKSGVKTAFAPPIYTLAWRGGALAPAGSHPPPKAVNLYNGTIGDITGQGRLQTVMINQKGYLVLLDANGQPLWRSTEHFGSTENYIERTPAPAEAAEVIDDEGGRFAPTRMGDPNVKRVYLNSPILLTDLNQDGKPEVIVSHNLPGLAQLTGSRNYKKGEILSLSWGGNGMLENWKTARIDGQISSMQVADLDGDGVAELIISTVHPPTITNFWKGEKSIILSYRLSSM